MSTLISRYVQIAYKTSITINKDLNDNWEGITSVPIICDHDMESNTYLLVRYDEGKLDGKREGGKREREQRERWRKLENGTE